jgi:predicted  nucleic acid-binding Zn-ribbon protein
MNPQLEKIIMLQDLDLMISELGDSATASQEKELGFQTDQLGTLQKARQDLAEEVDGELIAHYQKLHKRYKRAVVPVKNNICLACFLKQPTQYSTEMMDEIRTCDHCSRILYLL